MTKRILYLCLLLLLPATACRKKKPVAAPPDLTPLVSNNGQLITFRDTAGIAFFKTAEVNSDDVIAELSAPAKIAATVIRSGGGGQNIILFENPELAGSYTQLVQHEINISQIQSINIRQRQLELERTRDLQLHGAVTGQELLNAQTALSMEQTALANEKAALSEHEARLISAGFSPEILRRATAGTAYLICDIPENQIARIQEGSSCSITFTAFPGETYTGTIDAVAEVVDNETRMVKVRISIKKSSGKLKAGMFANVSFGLDEGHYISVSRSSLATVQGHTYVFVKTGRNTFERREVQTGQQIGEHILVFSGLKDGDTIAVEGVMQLKGLSFGY